MTRASWCTEFIGDKNGKSTVCQHIWFLHESLQLLSALYSDVPNFFLYRCTSTFRVQTINYCGRIFLKSLSYLCEVHGRTNVSADFWIFRNFDRNFAKIVAPPSNESKNYLAILKGQSLLKKKWKKNQNRPINSDTLRIQNMSLSNEKRAGQRAWQTKRRRKHTNTIFSHLQPAYVVRSLPNFAWWYRARRDHQKRLVAIIFRSNKQLFLQGAWKISRYR